MKGFAFIWIFLVKVREAIVNNRGTGQAFVSLRLMINVKSTYQAYREVESNITKQKGKISSDAITKPKTIEESMETFFSLFKESTKNSILAEVDYDEFKRIVKEKNKMPYNPDNPNFDTSAEEFTALKIIADYKAKQKTI